MGLAALERLSEELSGPLLAIAEDAAEDSGALALAALGRCDLGADQARVVAAALAAHITDEDPLAESAHAALIELVERGVLGAD